MEVMVASEQQCEIPEPLVMAEVDLRDFAFMPIDITRLLTSETWLTSTGDEKAAAMTLWLVSWHQVPSGSLPDNERMLATLSQAGARWKKVRPAALRGWVRCSDGRLYHPVVAEKALEAWDRKLKQRQKGKSGAAKRWQGKGTGNAPANAPAIAQAMPAPMPGDSKGQGQGQGQGQETPKPPRASPARPPSSRSAAADILEHWNAQPGLQHHRSINGQEVYVAKALGAHTADEVKTAISRYSQVRSAPAGQYRGVYSWTLGEFVSRHRGFNLVRFLADGWEEAFRPFESSGPSRPTKKSRYDDIPETPGGLLKL